MESARPNHVRILQLLEDGLVSYEFIVQVLLCYMRDDELADIVEIYELSK